MDGPRLYIFRRVYKVAEKRVLVLLCLPARSSVPPAWSNSTSTRRIFMKFDICVSSKIRRKEFKFHWNLTAVMGTWLGILCTFMVISRSVLLIARNVLEKKVVEKIITHILCSMTNFRVSCRLGDNVENFGGVFQTTDDNEIRVMRFVESFRPQMIMKYGSCALWSLSDHRW